MNGRIFVNIKYEIKNKRKISYRKPWPEGRTVRWGLATLTRELKLSRIPQNLQDKVDDS